MKRNSIVLFVLVFFLGCAVTVKAVSHLPNQEKSLVTVAFNNAEKEEKIDGKEQESGKMLEEEHNSTEDTNATEEEIDVRYILLILAGFLIVGVGISRAREHRKRK